MHPTVLAVTGYVLLLSSLITFVFLLRKICSKKNKSPFYILSTSDVFSTILTAIILLVNRIEAGIRLSYNWQNNTLSDMLNRTWTIEEEKNYQFPFLQIRNLREADLDVTLTCDMKDIFMQYGILLAALTNAFVSLLTLTLQCNLTAVCMKQRCTDIMKSLVNDIQLKPKDVKVTHRERKIPEDGQEPAFQQDNIDNVKNQSSFLQRIVKIFKYQITSKGDKPAKFFVTSHWLVPFLVVAILYFAEYNDMNTIRYTENTECVFDSNFPMNDFYIFSDVEDNLKIADSMIYTTPVGNKYLNQKLSSKIKPSSAEVDEIVLKVQKIVNSVLNYTGNSSENIKNINFLATSGSQSMADYVAANNIMNYIKYNINTDNVTKRLNDTLTEQNVSIDDAYSNTNNSRDSNRDLQASLFHDLLKNTSEQSDVTTFKSSSDVYDTLDKDDSYREDAQMYPASTEENQKMNQKTGNIAIMQNKTSVSNNQIYNNIMKRIQTAIKNYNRTINRHDSAKQQPNWSLDYVPKRKPNSIKNLFSSKNDDFNHYINIEMKNGTRHMINECLVSTKFLQLYLFVLFFAIYLLSILLFCILQMRGKHMCKSTRAILRTKTDVASTLLRNNSSEDNNTTIINVSPRLSTDDKENRHDDSMEGSNTSQEVRIDHSSRSDIETIKEDRKSDMEIKDENLFLEIDCMVRIFNTIKLSMILCIILWTPMFLGTLLRVFSCIRAPQWLTDTTFLSAISFGIIRNILNMYIIKIQEICSDAKMKDNRIHPVE